MMLGQVHAAGAGTSMLPPVQGSLLPRAWLHKRQEHAAYYERCVAELERHRAQLAVGTQSQEACCEAFDLLSECLAVSMEDCQTLSETMTQVDSTYVAQAARVLQLTESVQKSRELLAQTADALVASEAERDADEHTLYSVARYSHQKQKATKALHAWRRCAAHRASRRHLLRKALRRVQRVVIGAAFRRWLHDTAGKLDLQTRLQAVVRRVQHVALSSAFAQWHFCVCDSQREQADHRQAEELAQATRVLKSTQETLQASAKAMTARVLASVERKMQMRAMIGTVHVWRRCAAHRASRRHLLRKALRRVQHVVIGAAFRRWLHYTAGELDLETHLQAVVRRVQRVVIGAAFRRWLHDTAGKLDLQTRLQAVVRRVQHVALSSAFAQWHFCVCDSQREQADHRQAEELAQATRVLKSTQETLQASAKAMTARVLASVERKMQMRAMIRTVHVWRRCAAHRASRRHLLRKALRRVQHVVIGAAFRRWLHYTAGELDLETRLQAVVRRVQHVALSSAFAQWHFCVCDSQREQADHRQAEELAQATRVLKSTQETLQASAKAMTARVLASVERKMQMRAMIRTVHVWRRCAAHRASRRHLLRKALRRVQRVVIGAAFRRWLHYTAGELDLETRLQAVVRRVQHVALSSAFTRWDRAAHRALRVRTVCETALARLRLRVLWQAFVLWRKLVRRMKRVRGMMRHGHYRVLRGAFVSWLRGWSRRVQRSMPSVGATDVSEYISTLEGIVDTVSLRLDAAPVEQSAIRTTARAVYVWRRCAAHRASRRHLLRKALRRVQHVVIGAAFRRWLHYTAGKLDLETRLQAVVRRVQHVALSSAFARWDRAAHRALRVRTVCETALARLRLRVLWQAFVLWRKLVRRMKRVRGMMRHGHYRVLRGAFADWSATVKHQLEQRSISRLQQYMCTAETITNARVIRLFSLKAIHRTMLKHFNGWWYCTVQQTQCLVALKRFVGSLCKATCRNTFRCWYETVAQHHTKVRVQRKALRRVQHVVIGAAFRRWLHYTAGKLDLETRLQAVVRRVQHVALSSAFTRWGRAAHRALCVRTVCETALARLRLRVLWQAFVLWRKLVRRMRRVRGMMRHGHYRVLRGAFADWSEWVTLQIAESLWLVESNELLSDLVHSEHILESVLAKSVLYKTCYRAISKTFGTWRAYVLQHSKLRIMASNASIRRVAVQSVKRKIERRNVATSFHAWGLYAAEQSKTKRQTTVVFKYEHFTRCRTAFEAWHLAWRMSVAHKNVRTRQKSKVISHLQHVVIGAAFRRWLHYTAGKLDLQTRLQAVVRRVQHVALSSAFAQWHFCVCDSQREQADHRQAEELAQATRVLKSTQETLQASAKAMTARVLASVERKMQMRAMIRTVHVWRRCAAHRASRRHLLRKALRRVQRVVIGAAFRRWLHYTAGKLDLQTRLQAVVRRVQHVALSSAFAQWHFCVCDSQREQADHRQAEELAQATRVLKSTQETLQASAKAMTARVLASVERKMQMRAMIRTVHVWRRCAAHRASRRHLLRKALRRVQHVVIGAAFRRWLHYTAGKLDLETRLQAVVRRVQHVALSSAFTRWDRAAHRALRVRTVCETALARLRLRVLWQFFHVLVGATWRMKRVRGMMQHGHYRVLRGAFADWSGVVRYLVSKRSLIAQQDQLRQDVQRSFSDSVRTFSSSLEVKIKRYQQSHGASPQSCTQQGQLLEGVPPVAESVALATPRRNTHVVLSNFDRSESPIDDAQRLQRTPCTPMVSARARQLLDDLRNAEQSLAQHAR